MSVRMRKNTHVIVRLSMEMVKGRGVEMSAGVTTGACTTVDIDMVQSIRVG